MRSPAAAARPPAGPERRSAGAGADVAGKRTVLMTGASGYIAGQLLDEFRREFDLRLVDVKDTDRGGRRVPGVVVADLTDPDRTRYQPVFAGVDAVVHLGYRPPGPAGGDPDVPQVDRFETEFAHVRMAQNVYRAAYGAGLRRVVGA